MPRNGAGVYTLPAGNPVVTLTTISSTWANTTMSDIATALTQSLATTGVTPMTGPLQLVDGSNAVPALTWATETTSGWYRKGSHNFAFTLNTVDALILTSTGSWTIPKASGGASLYLNTIDQATVTPTTAGSLCLELSSDGAVVNSGGILVFSANSTVWKFGAIKGLVQNAAGNSIGDIGFYTRRVTTDATLTEAFRIQSSGAGLFSAPMSIFVTAGGSLLNLNSTGGFPTITINDGTVSGIMSIVTGSNSVTFGAASGSAVSLRSAGVDRLTIDTIGRTVIPAPTSAGTALTINGVGVSAVATLNSAGGTGLGITGPAATQLNAISIQQTGQSLWFIYTPASSNDLRIFSGSDHIIITSAGNVTINTPASGVSLTANGVANSNTLVVQSSTTNAQSFGAAISGGTTSADYNTQFKSANNATIFATIFGDGSLTIGTPTGGGQGIGTINATGIFVNGTAVLASGSLGTAATAFMTGGLNSTNTTFQTAMTFTLGVGTYRIQALLSFNEPTLGTGGIRFTIANGTGTFSTAGFGGINGIVNGTAINQFNTSFAFGFATIGTVAGSDFVKAEGNFVVTVAGTFLFQFSQNSISANATTLAAGCSLVATRVN